MAVTYTATALGAYRAILRNSLVSVQALASECVTFVHNLGACPTEIRAILRSSVNGPSGLFMNVPAVFSINASQAMLCFQGPNTCAAYWDIIAEYTHSIVS